MAHEQRTNRRGKRGRRALRTAGKSADRQEGNEPVRGQRTANVTHSEQCMRTDGRKTNLGEDRGQQRGAPTEREEGRQAVANSAHSGRCTLTGRAQETTANTTCSGRCMLTGRAWEMTTNAMHSERGTRERGKRGGMWGKGKKRQGLYEFEAT